MSDLISKASVCEILADIYPTDGEKVVDVKMISKAYEAVQDLPSAQQWIPVDKALPEAPYGCLVTVWDTDPVTFDEFENLLLYFVGWDGKQWNDAEGLQCPFEVIAWMPLPEPYMEVEHE